MAAKAAAATAATAAAAAVPPSCKALLDVDLRHVSPTDARHAGRGTLLPTQTQAVTQGEPMVGKYCRGCYCNFPKPEGRPRSERRERAAPARGRNARSKALPVAPGRCPRAPPLPPLPRRGGQSVPDRLGRLAGWHCRLVG